MAIKRTFEGIIIKLPSWSGMRKCPNCPKDAYSCGGQNKEGKLSYLILCTYCGFSESLNWKSEK